MHSRILTTVKQFLISHSTKGRPLILGLSGGPDSLALFHLLHRCQKFFPLTLHIAHVDHGWRQESGQEAEQLQKEVESLGYRFHLHTLQGIPSKEDIARQERLLFFRRLYDELQAQAVILGHHAGDQAETILKRIFEGASLEALSGIRLKATLEGMEVWRPLLRTTKAEILAWIKEEKLNPFEDPTNHDPKYLRSRLRVDILPQLSQMFGKEVSGNLCRLGESAEEFNDYLGRKLKRYEDLIEGTRVDFSSCLPLEPLEIKVFIKKIAERNKISLSHQSLRAIYQLLERGKGKGKVGARGGWIEVEGYSIAIKKSSGYLGQ